MKKKSSHSAVIYTPGRWTGNNMFLKGGLTSSLCVGLSLPYTQYHSHTDKDVLQKNLWFGIRFHSHCIGGNNPDLSWIK